MGYMIEVNTLVRFDTNTLKPEELEVGLEFAIELKRERLVPLHIALLLIDQHWNFYGYVIVHAIEIKDQKTIATFEVLTLFNEQERRLYTSKFLEAAKKTGEV